MRLKGRWGKEGERRRVGDREIGRLGDLVICIISYYDIRGDEVDCFVLITILYMQTRI
jgi:hypothetical protein